MTSSFDESAQNQAGVSATVRPDTAMVLAAGLGTRMQPLTNDRPKPLVELAGRALIDHVLERLAEAGIAKAVVNVHYQADMLEQHLNGRVRPEIVFSDERNALLDTGGGVVNALPLLGSNSFLIHNSDSVWLDGARNNITRLLSAWDPHVMDSLLLLADASRSLGYDGQGDFDMAADGRLNRRAQDQKSDHVFTGVSIAHPRLFKDAPHGCYSLNTLWDKAIAEGRLYGLKLEGNWMHVGTAEALSDAEDLIARHQQESQTIQSNSRG